jgi:hypothetical protein
LRWEFREEARVSGFCGATGQKRITPILPVRATFDADPTDPSNNSMRHRVA